MSTLTLPLPRFAAARYMADRGFPFAFVRESRSASGWHTTGRVPAWVWGLFPPPEWGSYDLIPARAK